MFVYFWRDWTATVQGDGWRAVVCAHCRRHFEYGIQGEGVGTAHDPYCGYDEKAKRVANKRAAKDLARQLADLPVRCPAPDVVTTSRRWSG